MSLPTLATVPSNRLFLTQNSTNDKQSKKLEFPIVTRISSTCTDQCPQRSTRTSLTKPPYHHRVLITIKYLNNCNNRTQQHPGLPSFLLLNAWSLLKLDELTALLSTYPVDLIAITEAWLHEEIDDSLLLVNGFNIFRKDRIGRRGGGVCVYLTEGVHCKRITDLENPSFRCLWLWLRPTRLPRPLSGIASALFIIQQAEPPKNTKILIFISLTLLTFCEICILIAVSFLMGILMILMSLT